MKLSALVGMLIGLCSTTAWASCGDYLRHAAAARSSFLAHGSGPRQANLPVDSATHSWPEEGGQCERQDPEAPTPTPGVSAPVRSQWALPARLGQSDPLLVAWPQTDECMLPAAGCIDRIERPPRA